MLDRDQLDRDVLELVEVLRAFEANVLRQEHVHAVRLDRRVRMRDAERTPRAGAVARLFSELARGGGDWFLARVDDPARHFERDSVDPEAHLSDQHGLSVGRERQHVHPVVRPHPDERSTAASLGLHAEEGVLVHGADRHGTPYPASCKLDPARSSAPPCPKPDR